jgi:hypothetical protein
MTQDELIATLPSVFMGLPLKHNVSSLIGEDGQVKQAACRPAKTACGAFEVAVAAPFTACYFFEKRPVFIVEADSMEEVEHRMRDKLQLLAQRTTALVPLAP